MKTTIRASCRNALLFAMGLILIGLAVPPAVADDDLGPPVGMKAPEIGMPLDQTGKPRSLADVMGPNGLVLVFFRSADWCPYCQRQLMDINGGLAEIEKRGYRVAALSYDKPEILAAFTEKRDIKFTFLSDPASEVIDRYNLRDPQYTKTSRAYGVPRPIIFILDAKGVIKAKLFEETYKTRPPVAEVVSKLDGLTGAK